MASLCAPKDESKKRAFDEVFEEENSGSEELPTPYEFLMAAYGGKELLEVFSVVMDNKGKEARFVSGTIFSSDYFVPEGIFSPERDNPVVVTIKPKDRTPLLLNGPVECITACDDVEVAVKLKDEVSGQVFDGYIGIISRSWRKPVYNKPLTFRCNMDENVGEPTEFSLWDRKEEEEGSSMLVEEEAGSLFVEVNLAVLSYAAPAVFEVKLINHIAAVSANGNANANAKVYGRITAFSECFGEGCESVLFDQGIPSQSESKSESESESEGGNVIPLSRSVVAVPVRSNHLIVRAELYDGDGKEIALGRANFSVIPFSIIQKNISGEFGEICVKVTWQSDPRIPASPVSDS